jgi:hypothetical protein
MKLIRKNINDIAENDKQSIDHFIESNNGMIFYETLFNTIVSEFFKSKLTYFLAYDNNSLIGICPCHTFNKGFVSQSYSNLSSMEIPYGGWIYDTNKVTMKKLLAKTKIPYNEILQYSSNIQFDENLYHDLKKYKPYRINTVIMELSPSIDDVYYSLMKYKQRNKIERARKLGITVEEITIENIGEFFTLSKELKEKVGLNVKSESLYQKVLAAYNKNRKAVCLAAKLNEEYISAMILLSNKNYTTAWVAGRKAELPNNLYQNELLWWETIVYAKNRGSKYLDFCGLDKEKLPHLARIKLSFSKEIVPFYVLTKKSLLLKILNKIKKTTKRIMISSTS